MTRSVCFIAILLLNLALPRARAAEPSALEPSWTYVETKLKKAKFKKAFIKELQALYDPSGFEEVVKLNVLLPLRKQDYHGVQVTESAAKEIQGFIAANQSALAAAESRYRVPGPVISSLLWMESRYGSNLGRFHVPSVYLDLVQADRKAVVDFLQASATEFTEKPTRKQRREIGERASRKVRWALGELHSLEKIRRKNWQIGKEFTGSFSGAFGMAQFIPSSYLRWAKSPKAKAQPDLTKAEDAIESVAYYLHKHGWRSKRKTHLATLMKYNNSRDYARAILRLAEQASSTEKFVSPNPREPASRKK